MRVIIKALNERDFPTRITTLEKSIRSLAPPSLLMKDFDTISRDRRQTPAASFERIPLSDFVPFKKSMDRGVHTSIYNARLNFDITIDPSRLAAALNNHGLVARVTDGNIEIMDLATYGVLHGFEAALEKAHQMGKKTLTNKAAPSHHDTSANNNSYGAPERADVA